MDNEQDNNTQASHGQSDFQYSRYVQQVLPAPDDEGFGYIPFDQPHSNSGLLSAVPGFMSDGFRAIGNEAHANPSMGYTIGDGGRVLGVGGGSGTGQTFASGNYRQYAPQTPASNFGGGPENHSLLPTHEEWLQNAGPYQSQFPTSSTLRPEEGRPLRTRASGQTRSHCGTETQGTQVRDSGPQGRGADQEQYGYGYSGGTGSQQQSGYQGREGGGARRGGGGR